MFYFFICEAQGNVGGVSSQTLWIGYNIASSSLAATVEQRGLLAHLEVRAHVYFSVAHGWSL